MQLKKGRFGYISFGIGAIILSVYLYTLFVAFIKAYENGLGIKAYFFNMPFSYVLPACILVLTVGLYFLISFLKSKICVYRNNVFSVCKTILYICIFISAIAHYVYSKFILISSNWGNSSPLHLFEWQRLQSYFCGNVVNFDNKIDNAYSFIESSLLKIFGFTPNVVYISNSVFILMASILLFFAVKYICGYLPALVAFFGMVVLLPSNEWIFNLKGIALWILIVAFVAFVTAYFLDAFSTDYPVTSFLIFIAVFAFTVALNDLLFEKLSFIFIPDESVLYDLLYNNSITAFISIFSLLGVLSFVYSKKDNISLPLFFAVALALLTMFDYSNNIHFAFFGIALLSLAGIGLNWLLFEGYKRPLENSVGYLENVEKSAEEAEVEECAPTEEAVAESAVKEGVVADRIVAEGSAEDTVASENAAPENSVEEKILIEQSPEANNVIKVSEVETHVLVNSPEDYVEPPKKPVTFIDNPLPGPKKHVKKNLEFAMEPKDYLMKFDVEISDNDDFDI